MNLLFALALLASTVVQAQTVKVAVVDTGFDTTATWPAAGAVDLRAPKICLAGHQSFVGQSINDEHGHGTHIAGLIAKYAGNSDYCLVILKYYSPGSKSNLSNSNRALRAAIDEKVDVINYSGGGFLRDDLECSLIKEALDKNIIVVAAAGNGGINIDRIHQYPAFCDNRVKIVVNIDGEGRVHPTSNFLSMRPAIREIGTKVLSLLPENKVGFMTGTSQSTAVATGKIVKILADDRRAHEKSFKNITNREKHGR